MLGLAGLFATPLAALGIAFLAHRRDLRFLAVATGLVGAYVAADIPGRGYYAAGLLPVLLAAGAVRAEAMDLGRPWRVAWPGALVAGAALSLVIVLPVLPLATFARIRALHEINYDLGETVGWPQLTTAVASVYDRMPPRQRPTASIFTSNYGEAGAIAWYGPAYGLPAPLSGHNNYWLWDPGQASDQVVVTVGAVSQLRPHFARCRFDATIRSPHDVNNDENGVQIWTCTGPRGPWSSFWPSLRHYG